ELAMLDTGPGAHPLHVAGTDHRTFTPAIPMRPPPFQDVRNDLHVPVSMGSKTGARGDVVVIDHPQRAKAHVPGILIIRERKSMRAVKPAEIGMTALTGCSENRHGTS